MDSMQLRFGSDKEENSEIRIQCDQGRRDQVV